jgi:DNA-binding PadR family transcriptional regulator
MAKAKKPLGELEQLVLLALVRLDHEGYGVRVRDEIGRRTGRALTLGSVYKTLLRLEEKGMVGAQQGEPTPERGGRRKTYYSVLPPGHRALQYSLAGIRRMTQGLDPVWDAP